MKPNNTETGFYGNVEASVKDPKLASHVWNIAFEVVSRYVPKASSLDVRNFLDSVYGQRVADQLLSDLSEYPDSKIEDLLKDQIDSRKSRFLKKFKQVSRESR